MKVAIVQKGLWFAVVDKDGKVVREPQGGLLQDFAYECNARARAESRGFTVVPLKELQEVFPMKNKTKMSDKLLEQYIKLAMDSARCPHSVLSKVTIEVKFTQARICTSHLYAGVRVVLNFAKIVAEPIALCNQFVYLVEAFNTAATFYGDDSRTLETIVSEFKDLVAGRLSYEERQEFAAGLAGNLPAVLNDMWAEWQRVVKL